MPSRAEHAAWGLPRSRVLFAGRAVQTLVRAAREAGISLRGAVVLGTANVGSLIFQEEPDQEHLKAFVKPFHEAFRAGEPWPAEFPPILIDRSGKIWDGHHRAEAAILAGYEKIPVLLLKPNRKVHRLLTFIGNSYNDLVDAVAKLDPEIRRSLKYDIESIHHRKGH